MSARNMKDEVDSCLLRSYQLVLCTETLAPYLGDIKEESTGLTESLVKLRDDIHSRGCPLGEVRHRGDAGPVCADLRKVYGLLDDLCQITRYYHSPATSGRWGAVEGLSPSVLDLELQPRNIARFLASLSIEIDCSLRGRSQVSEGVHERLDYAINNLGRHIMNAKRFIWAFSAACESSKAAAAAHVTAVTQVAEPVQSQLADVWGCRDAYQPRRSQCAVRAAGFAAPPGPPSRAPPTHTGTSFVVQPIMSEAQAGVSPARALQVEAADNGVGHSTARSEASRCDWIGHCGSYFTIHPGLTHGERGHGPDWLQDNAAPQEHHMPSTTASARTPSDEASVPQPSVTGQHVQRGLSEWEELEVPSEDDEATDNVLDPDWVDVRDPSEADQEQQTGSFDRPIQDKPFTTPTGLDIPAYTAGAEDIEGDKTAFSEAVDGDENTRSSWSDLLDVMSKLELAESPKYFNTEN